jgi:hypothetical protein
VTILDQAFQIYLIFLRKSKPVDNSNDRVEKGVDEEILPKKFPD